MLRPTSNAATSSESNTKYVVSMVFNSLHIYLVAVSAIYPTDVCPIHITHA